MAAEKWEGLALIDAAQKAYESWCDLYPALPHNGVPWKMLQAPEVGIWCRIARAAINGYRVTSLKGKKRPRSEVAVGLTPRQTEGLACIEFFIKKNGHSPTYHELAELLNCSYQNAMKIVYKLEERGRLRRKHDVSRSIVLTDAPDLGPLERARRMVTLNELEG